MDRRIRILALAMVVLFGLLFLQLNNLQVRQASALANSPLAPNISSSAWNQPRGSIVTSDGVVIAETTKTAHGYIRHYPQGGLFADVTGYYDVTARAAPLGLESSYDSDLLVHAEGAHNLHEVLTERTGTDTVETTISSSLQHVAAAALGDLDGAIVVIEPSTGAVLAMYSNPTYDPNELSTRNGKEATAYFNKLSALGGSSPLVNGVTRQRIAPGSTFKVITTAAIFDSHNTTLAQAVWPIESEINLPYTTSVFHNFDSEACGGPLAEVLAVSCDTAYAQIGMQLGATTLAKEAAAFGFGKVPPIDLPDNETVPSVFPSIKSLSGTNKPFLAYSSIGQYNVAETPLEDALVTSAIADNGTIMTPHLLANVIDSAGHIVTRYKPHAWLQATSRSTANEVRTLMLGVATSGTAAGVFPADLHVAAKTGTAETAGNCSADWMIATAPAGTGQTPKIAVAVYVPYQPSKGVGCSETGAIVAGPIAAKVITAALTGSK